MTQTAVGSVPPPSPPSADVIWHVWYKCQPWTYLAETLPAASCRLDGTVRPSNSGDSAVHFYSTLLPLNSPISQCAYLINSSKNKQKKNTTNNPVIITVRWCTLGCLCAVKGALRGERSSWSDFSNKLSLFSRLSEQADLKGQLVYFVCMWRTLPPLQLQCSDLVVQLCLFLLIHSRVEKKYIST